MNLLVFDLEANGFLEVATTVHCACIKDHNGTARYTNEQIPLFLEMLSSYDVIICHNALSYDLPLLEKLYGYKHKGIVLDTLVLSRLLNPERVGRHSLEAWGERFGVPKPKHEEWDVYSPEMLHRCQQDVEINWLVLYELLKEANLTEEELWKLPKLD